MKKLFYFLGAAAMMASCSNEDLMTEVQPNGGSVRGENEVVFGIGNSAVTRGLIEYDADNKTSNTNWEAEIDEFGVVYSGVYKGGSLSNGIWNNVAGAYRPTGQTGSGYAKVDAQDLTNGVAVYKATRTGKEAYATAATREDILTFDPSTAWNKQLGSFRIYRPVSKAANSVVYTKTAGDAKENANVESIKVKVADFTAQTQPTAKANFGNFFMVSQPVDGINNAGKQAVGESIELEFGRAFSAMAIQIAGYDRNTYGKLKTITVSASNLNIAASDATVDIAQVTKNADNEISCPIAYTSGSKNIVLTVGDPSTGLAWNSEYYAYLQILPLNEGLGKLAADKSETITIVCEFANYTVTVTKSLTKADADLFKQNTMSRFTVDLKAQPFLYDDNSNSLIVNSSLPTIITKNDDPNKGKFQWNENYVNPAAVVKFSSTKELSANELATIKSKYTGVQVFTLADQASALGNDLANITATPGQVTSLTLTKSTVAPVITAGKCSALTTINCPEATSIPAEAYKGNDVLAAANFPKVVTIGASAFEDATNITSIKKTGGALTVGDALTTIGDRAFFGITDMNAIEANGVTEIGYYGFGYNPLIQLTSVKLPKYDFNGTTENNAYVKSALLSSKNTSLATLDLSAVTEIGNKVVVNVLKALTSVTLNPNGVVICDNAFNGLSALTTIKNLDKATSIGKAAFKDTKIGVYNALTGKYTVTLNNAITAIPADAFSGNTQMTDFVATGVKTIADGAFSGCTNLSSINLTNVESIGVNAFVNCAMTNITLSAATSLPAGAFKGTTGGLVTLDNVTSIAKNSLALSNASTIMMKKAATIDVCAFISDDYASLVKSTNKNAPTIVDCSTFNLIVNTAQAGVENSNINLTVTEGDKTYYFQLQFGSIVKAF